MKKTKIQKIIEDATVDCYNEYEQASGWQVTLEDNIRAPQECKAGEIQCTLKNFEVSAGGTAVNAVVKINGNKLKVSAEQITIKNKNENVYIEAYKKWL